MKMHGYTCIFIYDRVIMEIEKSHSQASETEEIQWLVPVRVQRRANG